MPKLTEYTAATSFDANDILIKDGTGGTKKISIENVVSYLYQQLADMTLTETEKFAQAKAVGDALTALGADITSLGTEASAIKAMLAPEEADSTATRNYTAGEFLVTGDKLYKVTANIANGGSIVANLNVTETTIGAQLTALQSGYASLSTIVTSLSATVNGLASMSPYVASMKKGLYVAAVTDSEMEFLYTPKESFVHIKSVKFFPAGEHYKGIITPTKNAQVIVPKKYAKVIIPKGKNLFNRNGFIDNQLSTTGGSYITGISGHVAWIPIIGGKTYTITAPNRNPGYFRVFGTHDFPVSFATSNVIPIEIDKNLSGDTYAGVNTATLTLPESVRWLGIYISTNTDNLSDKIVNLQVEEGSTSTAYEEFKGVTVDIPLKAGNSDLTVYYGEIDIDNGKIINDGAMYRLSGSENWSTIGSGSSAYYTCVVSNAVPSESPSGYCTHFPYVDITDDGTEEGICVEAESGNSTRIKVRPGSLLTAEQGGTVEAFMSWISGIGINQRPVVVYHVAEPSESEIPSAVLEQLSSLKSGSNKSFAYALGYSNSTVDPQTGFLTSYLGTYTEVSLEYCMDVKGYVDAKIAELAALIPTT